MKISLADYFNENGDSDGANDDQSDQGLVWHYTKPNIFALIVENDALWATDVNHLNDSDEIHIGISEFGKMLKARQEEAFSPKDQLEDLELDVVRELVESWKDYPLTGSAFTVSFSQHGDDNSQWDRYAANASGFAIGFRKEAYMPILGDETPAGRNRSATEDVPFYWTKMHYELEDQQKAIESAVSEVLDGMSRKPYPDEETDMTKWIREQALSSYSRAVASIKNPGFRAENEYRYVVSRPGAPSVIQKRPDGVEYVRITGGPAEVDPDPRYRPTYQADPLPLPIEVVRLGPKSAKSVPEIEDVLRQHGYADVRVVVSESTQKRP